MTNPPSVVAATVNIMNLILQAAALARRSAPVLLIACLLSAVGPAAAKQELRSDQAAALQRAREQFDAALRSVSDANLARGFDALPASMRVHTLDVAAKLISTASGNAEKVRLLRDLSHSTRIRFPEGSKGDALFQTFWDEFAQQMDHRLASRSSPARR